MPFLEFIRDVGKHLTVNYMLAKDSVKKRIEGEGEGMSFTEFTYQLVQGHDFFHLWKEHGVQLQMGDTEETLKSFPFRFLLTMEVRLAPAALEIGTTITNRSAAPMPFSFGLHPYFNLSSLDGVRFEGLPAECLNHLTMAPASTAEQMEHLASGIDLLVRPNGPVRLVDEAAGATLELQLSHPFDLVVLWTEPPRPMVCIEPWSGPRQALLSGDRRIELAPGASTELNTRYALTCSPGVAGTP
jgi:galactose mutarotase-like enzyme